MIESQTKVRVKEFEDWGIFQVRLPLPFRLNHVNCYVIRDGEGWVVIDTGLNYPDGRRAWAEAMKVIGMSPQEIVGIYLTHYHPDHFGMAGYLQQYCGAPVYVSAIDAQTADLLWERYNEYDSEMRKLFLENGVPQDLAAGLIENMLEMPRRVRPLPELTLLDHGQSVKLGNYMYETIWTPGHSDGHICYFCQETGIIFSGDHLLPRITSNIGLWPHSRPNPLKSFIGSLNLLKDLPIKTVLPAHDWLFTDHVLRINQFMEHHRERLELMLGCVDGVTAFDVCRKAFSPDLNLHELRFAIVETLAHLAYLVEEGKIAPSVREGVIVYYRV